MAVFLKLPHYFFMGKNIISHKKEKQIHFTKEGQLLAEKIIKPVIEAEKQSFEQLDSREIEVMFETTYKHMKKLESLIESIKN